QLVVRQGTPTSTPAMFERPNEPASPRDTTSPAETSKRPHLVKAVVEAGPYPTRRWSAERPSTGQGGPQAHPNQPLDTSLKRSPNSREVAHPVAGEITLVEHSFSVLKCWAIFRCARCCPKFLDQIGKAVLTLELNQQQ